MDDRMHDLDDDEEEEKKELKKDYSAFQPPEP